METPNYPSNSRATPPPEGEGRKAERAVANEVTSRPKSIGKRLREALIGGDSKTALQYVISEVIIPQAKDMLAEAATQAFHRFIFGDGPSGTRRSSGRGGSSYTAYNRYSARGNRPIGSSAREERTTVHLRSRDLDEIICETRQDAQSVLEQMSDFLEEYQSVSVADLYTMLNWTDRSTHTDQKWGWENLQGSDIRMVRGGYLLILPKPIALD
jgi:hypothetical protein